MTQTKKKMGRPPPLWLLQIHSDNFISNELDYTRKQLADHYKKNVVTIKEVIENAYVKFYEKEFPFKKVDDGKNIIVLYPGKVLRKLSKEYSADLDSRS